MMKRFFVFFLASLAVGVSSFFAPAKAAYVYVVAAPPAAIVERVPARPGAGYVWVGGHYRWNGSRYVWTSGHYVHHGGNWCPGHWTRSPARGYFWVEGRWC